MITNPQDSIVDYRPFGEYASTTLTFGPAKPTVGKIITITDSSGNAWVFTVGTDFSVPSTSDVVPNLMECVNQFVNTIMGFQHTGNISPTKNAVYPFLAFQFGLVVQIVATTPGALGNLYKITSNDPAIVTSGATFTKGSSGASTVNSGVLEASHVLKATAGILKMCHILSTKGSAQFIQLFNSATVPADTAVPIFTAAIGAAANYDLVLPPEGLIFSTGIAISNSSTAPTKTIGAADCYFTASVY